MKRVGYFVLGLVMVVLTWFLYLIIRIYLLPVYHGFFLVASDYVPFFSSEEIIFPLIWVLPFFIGGVIQFSIGFGRKVSGKLQKKGYLFFFLSGLFLLPLVWLFGPGVGFVLVSLISLTSTFYLIKSIFKK